MTDGAAGSPNSRGGLHTSSQAFGMNLQIPSANNFDKNQSQPLGSKSDVEELGVDVRGSVLSGERSKQAG